MEDGSPLLYPRYKHVSEILLVGNEAALMKRRMAALHIVMQRH